MAFRSLLNIVACRKSLQKENPSIQQAGHRRQRLSRYARDSDTQTCEPFQILYLEQEAVSRCHPSRRGADDRALHPEPRAATDPHRTRGAGGRGTVWWPAPADGPAGQGTVCSRAARPLRVRRRSRACAGAAAGLRPCAPPAPRGSSRPAGTAAGSTFRPPGAGRRPEPGAAPWSRTVTRA